MFRPLLSLPALVVAIQSAGATDPSDGRSHWAFRVLSPQEPPRLKDATAARNQIDQFLLNKLQAAGLTFAPPANRETLIRRPTLDLIGEPPTPEEVEKFLKDDGPDAYENLIDRLLSSPHFGERWGRHWLDGAGYVDVFGGDNDAATVKLGESKWLYRDWVIRAFNEDKPFDRFLTEQIAGDELVPWRTAKEFTPEIRDALIATGFLRTAGDDTDENELNTLDIRHGVLQRTAEVLTSNLLGLTLQCAKCHDHKFEAISQADYYRIQALLQPAFNPDRWLQPKHRLFAAIPVADRKPAEEHNAAIEKQIAQKSKELEVLKHPKAPKPEIDALQKEIETLRASRKSWPSWHAVYDVGPPSPTRLLKRGNHETPREEIAPGFFEVLATANSAALLKQSPPHPDTSGRRLALAHWLTDPHTPAGALMLRVRVNRIWAQLFGKGLVETTENFGLTGAKPTHPELLDWLATEFVRGGQKLKPFLKLLMTSAAYRQSSQFSGPAPTADPDNKLLWRMRLKRLESEAIRDSLLAVSGKLDRALGGPPVPVESKPDGSFVPKDGERPRRSIYLLARRNYHPTLLNAFDQPNLTTNCTGRATSAVVLQSLAMLNDDFVQQQAVALAGRIGIGGSDEIAAAFRIVLGRSPTDLESRIARDLLARQRDHYTKSNPPERASRKALEHLCHVLLNTSEFLYVP